MEEFLNTKEEPMHISEIMVYVLKFRDTNVLNVVSNIKLEENNRFQVFAGEFVGLKRKNYINTDKYKRVSGSHFRISAFKNMNGWDFDDVVNFFLETFEYQPVQVKAIIEKKIFSGELSLTSNNKLIYEPNKYN